MSTKPRVKREQTASAQQRRHGRRGACCGVIAAALLVAGCGSSAKGHSSSSASSSSAGGSTSSLSASAGGNTATGSTWTVGAILDSTGTDALSGTAQRDGIEYYVNQVNHAGGVDGHKIALKFCDAASTPQGGAQCAQQLANVPTHTIAALTDDPVTRGGLPYLGKDIVTSVDSVLLPATNTHAYQTIVTNATLGTTLMQKLKSAGVHTLGVLYTTDTTGTKQYAALKQVAASAGEKVIGEPQPPGVTDVSPQLLKLKSGGAQAIYVASLGANTLAAVSSYHTLSLTTPIVGGGATTTNTFLQALSSGVPKNLYGISVLVVSPQSLSGAAATAWKQFTAGFTAALKHKPDNESATAYYAGCTIVAALTGTKGGSTPQMAQWLKRHSFSCLGSSLRFNVPGLNVVTGEPIQLAEAGATAGDGWGPPSGALGK